MVRRTRQTLQLMKQDRLFTRLLMLFIALSLADLLLTVIGLHLTGFNSNLVFKLLAARKLVFVALVWIGVTLLMVANMVISYTAPSAQTWARRVASDAWSLLHLHTLYRLDPEILSPAQVERRLRKAGLMERSRKMKPSVMALSMIPKMGATMCRL